MFHLYKRTPLEQWVETMYHHYGIYEPSHLTIDEVAARFHIWVYYAPMQSCCIERGNGLLSIVVDNRLPTREQWEDFLHEFCHALQHVGNQHHLPLPFVDWQEEHAAVFQLYAAIPFFMLHTLELPEHRSEVIAYLANEFKVTMPLAERRLQQIERRILQGSLDDEFRKHIQSKKTIDKPNCLETERILRQLYNQTKP